MGICSLVGIAALASKRGAIEHADPQALGLLPSTPPVRARAAGAAEYFVLPPLPPTDSIPAAVDLAGFGFSGNGPLAAETETRMAPTIEVAIRHGNLAYARHPVVVGHYQGDTVVSAEAVLDRQLGGALKRRIDLGIYPGPIGSHAVVRNESARARPDGAIVVGLGQVGGQSPGQLEESLLAALLDFALDVVHWPDPGVGDSYDNCHWNALFGASCGAI